MTSAYSYIKKTWTKALQPSASVVGRRGDPRSSPIPWQWCRGRLCRLIFLKKKNKKQTKRIKQIIVYKTWCSQAVTHLSTNHARRCLTSVIGREPVFSTWYGRRQPPARFKLHIVSFYLLQHCRSTERRKRIEEQERKWTWHDFILSFWKFETRGHHSKKLGYTALSSGQSHTLVVTPDTPCRSNRTQSKYKLKLQSTQIMHSYF